LILEQRLLGEKILELTADCEYELPFSALKSMRPNIYTLWGITRLFLLVTYTNSHRIIFIGSGYKKNHSAMVW